MHAERALRVNNRAREEPRQSEELWLEPWNAAVMRVEAGVVVDVDARKERPARGVIEHELRHMRERVRNMRRAGPDAIKVSLARQNPHAPRRGFDIADK